MKNRRLSNFAEVRAIQEAVIPGFREMAARLIPQYPDFWFYTDAGQDECFPRSHIEFAAICRKPCCLGEAPETRHEVNVAISLLSNRMNPYCFRVL